MRIEPFFRTLHGRFLIAISVVGIAPVAMVGLTIATMSRGELVERSSDRLIEVGRGAAGQLSVLLRGAFDNQQWLADLPSIAGMEKADQDKALRSFYLQHPLIAQLLVRDHSGAVLASSEPEAAPPVRDEFSFARAISGRQTWVVTDGATTRRQLTIYTPIRSGQTREVLGVLEAAMDLKDLSIWIAGLASAAEVETAVLDQRQRVVLHRDPEAIAQALDYSWLDISHGAAVPGTGTTAYELEERGTVTAAYAPVPEMGWTVLVEQPRWTILAPAMRSWKVALGGLAGSTALALLAGTVLTARVTRPLRELTRAAAALGSGDRDAPLPKVKVQDGNEVSSLVHAFETMRRQINTREEALEERTRELEVLVRTAKALQGVGTVRDRLGQALQELASLTGAYRVIFQPGEADRSVARRLVVGHPVQHDADATDHPLSSEAMRRRETMVLNLYEASPYAQAELLQQGVRSAAAFFIPSSGAPLGTLTVSALEEGHFTSERVRVLNSVGVQLGAFIENARLNNEIALQEELKEQTYRFVSIASHEMRGPLTTVVGYARLLADRGFDVPQAKDWLQTINNDAGRLGAMVDDMLTLTRIEAGEMPVALQTVDLALLVVQAVDRLRMMSARHDLVVSLTPDLPKAWADPDRFVQVLDNLLTNAIKYSPEGGRVEVKAAADADGHRVLVSVRDAGIGIAPEDQARLFMPFGRIDRDETKRIKGTGLGLYITKQLIELMGGGIWLESAIGRGSTFFVSVPTLSAKPSPEQAT